MDGQALLHNIDRRESYYKDGELCAAYTIPIPDKIQAARKAAGEVNIPTHLPNDFIDKPEIFEDFDTISTPRGPKVIKITRPGKLNDLEAGKLVGIPEPAGKMRVIALCDSWTQSVFEPLHNVLFDVLRTLPNDGTFDQDASYCRVQRKSLEAKGIYCADLSAATDRLPIILQEYILNELFGKQIGTHWADLLRLRPFVVREPLGSLKAGSKVYYGTGQPMGCLSSWAMLALCHHFILQGCCYNLGMSNMVWHTCYEILGDDIVIFDKDVYNEYVAVMGLLNVETNPTKSLISEGVNKVVEFAKRTSINGVDVSGLSWRQFIVSKHVRSGCIPLILWLGERGLVNTPGQLVKLLSGASKGGYYLLSDKHQKIVNNFVVSLLNHFAHIGLVSLRSAFSYIVDPRVGEEDLSIDKLPVTMMLHDLIVMMKGVPLFRDSLFFDHSNLLLDDPLYRDYLVGEKLLPFWGYRADTKLSFKLKKLSETIFSVQDDMLRHLSPHVFPESVSEGTIFEIDFRYFLVKVAGSLLDFGFDYQYRITELSQKLINSIEFKSFETSAAVREEITLFLEKYSFLETLNKSKETGSKIPMPLKDIEFAYSASKRVTQAITGFEGAMLMHYLHTQRNSRGAKKAIFKDPRAFM